MGLNLSQIKQTFGLICFAALTVAPAFAQRGPASVFATEVVSREFSNRLEALGTLQANETVELTVNVADRVTGVYFEDGQRVKAGDPLLSLIQGQQAARVEAAVATVNEARNVVARMKPLVEEGAVAQMSYDQAKRDLAVAEANLTSLRIEQKERILVAPFEGELGFREVSKGSYLRPGDTVTTLVDDSVMKLDFDVPSIEILKLTPGLSIEATTDDFPGRVFKGDIRSISNRIDPVTRSVTVRALIPNEDRILRAGTFMNVVVKAETSEGLAVPEEAIEPRGPKTFVYIAEKKGETLIASRREVELGRREGNLVEIMSGLSAGETVITEGVIRIREGAPVIVQDKKILLPKSAPQVGDKPASHIGSR